jgi:hypothetical protein
LFGLGQLGNGEIKKGLLMKAALFFMGGFGDKGEAIILRAVKFSRFSGKLGGVSYNFKCLPKKGWQNPCCSAGKKSAAAWRFCHQLV